MQFDQLSGWKKIEDLPSLDELNRFLERRKHVDRTVLFEVAGEIDEYRNPSHFREGFRMVTGLTFCTVSGSVLMTFPSEWPSSPEHRFACLYIMGETTSDDYSDIVRRFYDEFETAVLPAEAHAGDGG